MMIGRQHTKIGLLECFLAVALVVTAGESSASASKESDSPDELASQALAVNPAVKSIEKQIEALRHRTDAVQVWADPVLAVEFSNVPWDTWSLGDSPMSGVQFMIKQTFVLPGKNHRRFAVAQGELKVKQWELKESQNQLRAMVKQAFWKLALVRELRRITSQHIGLLDQLVMAARAKYQVGKGGQYDLLRLEVLKKKLSDDLNDFDQKDKEFTAALNAALQRPSETRVSTPNKFWLAKPSLELPDLMRLAEQHRPLLMQVQAQAVWQREVADQVAYERWPDITVWAGYRIRTPDFADPGTDFFSLGLSVPLPFDFIGRYKAKAAEHLAAASAADQARRMAVDKIRAALETALASWVRAIQKVATYQDSLIPEADKTLKATLAAYRTDRADFASLYQAELQLLQFERTVRVAEVTAQLEKIKVEAEVGTGLDRRENSEVLQ